MQKNTAKKDEKTQRLLALVQKKPIVLVGMMGAGKTTIGRRLALRLGIKFIDSDNEIEQAAGMNISDFFKKHGEAEFRKGEVKVIKRILQQKNIVLGVGGGALINQQTKQLILKKTISIWIRADFDLLFARISKRNTRPLMQTKNPKKTLKKLIDERYPIYQQANITLISKDVPHDEVVSDLIDATIKYLEDRFVGDPFF